MLKYEKGKMLIIDVRDRRQHLKSDKNILKNTINIPLNKLEDRVKQFKISKDTPIIVFCTSGKMSKVATIILKNIGYKNVYDIGSYKNLKTIGL